MTEPLGSTTNPAAIIDAALAGFYSPPQPWDGSDKRAVEAAVAAAVPLIERPLRAENERLRAALNTLRAVRDAASRGELSHTAALVAVGATLNGLDDVGVQPPGMMRARVARGETT